MSASIQWRCSRMREHMQGGCDCHPKLPAPCPDCYSLLVTSERIPYQPPTAWSPTTETGPEPAPLATSASDAEAVWSLINKAEAQFAWNADHEPAECVVPVLSGDAVRTLRAVLIPQGEL